jgi:hypothetical protein
MNSRTEAGYQRQLSGLHRCLIRLIETLLQCYGSRIPVLMNLLAVEMAPSHSHVFLGGVHPVGKIRCLPCIRTRESASAKVQSP